MNKYLSYEEAAKNAVRHFMGPECWGPDVECYYDANPEDLCWYYSLYTNQWVQLYTDESWETDHVEPEDRYKMVFWSYVLLSARQATAERTVERLGRHQSLLKYPSMSYRNYLKEDPRHLQNWFKRLGKYLEEERFEYLVREIDDIACAVSTALKDFNDLAKQARKLGETEAYNVEFIPYYK